MIHRLITGFFRLAFGYFVGVFVLGQFQLVQVMSQDGSTKGLVPLAAIIVTILICSFAAGSSPRKKIATTDPGPK